MPQRVYNLDGQTRALQAPVPARTESYTPIPNSYFLETVPQLINSSGLRVTGMRTYTNLLGTKMTNYISVINPHAEANDLGIEMMLGGRNSYDKSMSAALAAGANVMICGNGVVQGDMLVFRRKHMGTII